MKERIKLCIFPAIAFVMNKLGYSWERIGYSLIGKYTLIAQGRAILKKSNKASIKKFSEPKHFVFLTILGGHTYNAGIDICLAKCLKERGHKVDIIIDDMTFPITQQITSDNEEEWEYISRNQYDFAKKYFSSFGLTTLLVSSFYDEVEPESNLINYAEIEEASLLRHYKVGVIESSLPNLQSIKNRVRASIELSSKIGKRVATWKPSAVIMSHGIYSTWGPAFQILRKAEVPVLTYGRGKKAGTSKFNWNCTADWWDVDEAWNALKTRQLSIEESDLIEKYLRSRVSHAKDVFVYNFGDFEERDATLKRFDLDPAKTTYSLFTNVLWDAASAQREIVFRNPIEWVLETIRWFSNNQEKQLIVKIHPAERVIGTNMPFISILRKVLIDIPSNVRIIEPDEKVNSWSIYNVTDLGLVHTTTVGMELPLQGIPSAVVSRTHYRGKGFTIDVKNKSEYFDLLKNFNPDFVDSAILQEQSKKYAYLLFECYQMPLDIFNEKISTDVRSFRFATTLELYNKPTIKRVINALENNIRSILN